MSLLKANIPDILEVYGGRGVVVPLLQHAASQDPLLGVGLEPQDLGIILMAAVRPPLNTEIGTGAQ